MTASERRAGPSWTTSVLDGAVRAVLSFVVPTVLLVVPPVALLKVFGPPWLDPLPRYHRLEPWIEYPLDHVPLLLVLEVTLWVSWALLTISIAIGSLRRIRRVLSDTHDSVDRRLRLGRGLDGVPRPGIPMQVVAGGIAGVAAVAFPTTAAGAHAAPAADSLVPAPLDDIDEIRGPEKAGPAASAVTITAGTASDGPVAAVLNDATDAAVLAADTDSAADADSAVAGDAAAATAPAVDVAASQTLHGPTSPAPSPPGVPPTPPRGQGGGPIPDPMPTTGWWLPDGSWITLPVALVLIAAWRTIAAATDHPAIPRTVAAVLRRSDRHATMRRHQHRQTDRDHGPGTLHTAADPPAPPLPAPADLPAARFPSGGTGLTGPGATAAARGQLIASLLARPGAIHILTTEADWKVLAAATPPPPEVTVVADQTAIFAALEQRVLATDRPHSPAGTRRHAPDRPGVETAAAVAPVLLVTTVPAPADAARLAVALRLGQPSGTGAVLIGPWPHATTWHVDHAGRITPDPLPRDATLRPDVVSGPGRPGDAASPTRPTPSQNLPRVDTAGGRADPFAGRLTVLTAEACADILSALRPPGAQDPPQPDSSAPEPAHQPARTPADPHPTGTRRGNTRRGPRRIARRTVRRRTERQPPRRSPRQPLSLQLLGQAQLIVTATRAPVRLPRQSALDILVLLAHNPDGLDRDSILEALWPDVRHRSAVTRLHTALSSLRTTAATVTATPILIRTTDRYHLNPAALAIDR